METRHENHKRLWIWLSKNPEKQKNEWPEWGRLKYLDPKAWGDDCFACGEADERADGHDQVCSFCPLDWGAYIKCNDKGALFLLWENAVNVKKRSELALKIARMKWR